METQKTLNSQSNPEKEKQKDSGFLNFRLYYTAIVIKDSMVLAHKQNYRSMEQEDRKVRNKFMHLWSIHLQQRRQDYTMGKRVSSINGAGKTGQLHVKKKMKT